MPYGLASQFTSDGTELDTLLLNNLDEITDVRKAFCFSKPINYTNKVQSSTEISVNLQIKVT
jgi:hypothetical protein